MLGPLVAVALATGCTSSDPAPAAVAPADGRCGVTPRLLVAASTYPIPTDAGPVTSSVGPLIAAGSDLYYAISVIPVVAPGLGATYFGGSLLRVPKAGGEPTLVATAALFLELAVTATSLLVAESSSSGADQILSVPLGGGAPTTLWTAGTNESLGLGLASDGHYVYVGTGIGVRALPLASDASSPTEIPLTSTLASTVAVLGQQLVMALPQGEMESVTLPPRANAPVTNLGTAGAGQDDLQPCGSDVCWRSEGPSAIWRMNPLAGSPRTVATLTGSFQEAHGLVFDGTHFYFAGSDGPSGPTSVARVSSDGSGPVAIVTTQEGNAAIAVDDECIYWSSAGGIFSLAKTADGPFEQ
jgi:hypothetical protein